MFSRFFIDRPIFASVLSIVITLAGAVAVFTLPMAQYPQITPPSIIVTCSYAGASAKVLAETIAAPIEQQVNGVEDMLYMSSQCTNDGSYSLTVTFKPGVNLNFAQVLVQNRVNLALPMLPDVVKQAGVTTRKRNPDILLVVSAYSPDDRYDQLYLSNYVLIHLKDEIARVDGVGDVAIFGTMNYSMRIWVDPDRLASYGLGATDVVNAVREQNQQVATGQIGQEPVQPGQQQQITLSTLGRLKEPEQFENIIIKTGADNRIVRLKDVGSVELGGQSWDVTSTIRAATSPPSSSPMPTLSTPATASAPRWKSSRRASPPASITRSLSTPRPSFANRWWRSFTRSGSPSSWWPWSSWSFCRTGDRR